MKTASLACLALGASRAIAAPAPETRWDHPGFCISDDDAVLIGNEFGLTISNYTEALAVQLFAEGFTDQSDSVNQLINSGAPAPIVPLGTLTFPSKEAFLAGQGAQPPVPFEVLNNWHTCSEVIIRWRSAQKPLQVQGFSALQVQPAKPGEGGGFGVGHQKWQIIAVLAEFNSGAWLVNLGNPECPKA